MERTGTGHLIGAVYRSSYWGGTYKVIGPSDGRLWYGSDGVEVECVTAGGGAHQTPGERWQHCTALDKHDRLVAS